MSSTTTPYRVVDRFDRGWHVVGPVEPDGPPTYSADYGFRDGLDGWSFERVEVDRGPLRPVVPVPDGDREAIETALRDAGTLAAGSVCVALYKLMMLRGGKGEVITAGRGGSWESEAVKQIGWGPGVDLEEKPRRWSASCVDVLVKVMDRWSDPEQPQYVELAETLAAIFASVTDELGGWPSVADRWWQPGERMAMNAETIEYVQGYLIGTSEWWALHH